MLDPEQLLSAKNKLESLERRLVLELATGPDPQDPFARALVEVVEALVKAAPDRLQLVHNDDSASHPSLRVENIKYLAVPLDRELEPFLDLLGFLAGDSGLQPPSRPPDPARLEVLIASTCPNCPAVVRACGQVASCLPAIEMSVIDVQYFTEIAGSCRSVPTVIIDGAYTVVGGISTKKLLDLLEQRREPGHLARALGSMIEAGRLSEMAALLKADEGHAAMATLMKDGSMQQRMGLMLAVEQVLEHNPHEMDAAVPHLLPLLQSDNATVRGDGADLIGRIGAPGARDALSQLLDDENPDVREVAEEAISQLRSPS